MGHRWLKIRSSALVLGVQFAVIALALAAVWLASPLVASASDCNVPSDCKGAATTARNPIVPIAATGAGAGTAVLIDAVRRKPDPGTEADEEEPEERAGPEIPCQAASEQFAQAQVTVKSLQIALQSARDLLASLDNLYEIHRFKATMSGGIDAAFGIGGLFGGPSAGSLVKDMLIAGMKNVVKEGVKQTANGMFVGGVEIDFAKLTEEAYKGGKKTAMLDALGKELQERALQQALDPGRYVAPVLGAPKGVGLSGPVGKAVRRSVKPWAEDLASGYMKFVGGLMDLVGMAQTAVGDAQALEHLRESMSDVRGKIFEMETQLDTEALPAMRDALAGYRGCLQIWIDGHGDDWMEQWVLYYGGESLAALRASGILRHVGGAGMRMP